MSYEKIDEALELFYQGDSAGAEVMLQEVGGGKLQPPSGLEPLHEAAYWEGVGGLALVKEQGEEAAKAFRRMIELEEKGGADQNNHATSYAKLGEALALQDALDEAIEAFTKAVEIKEKCEAPPYSTLSVVYRYADCLYRHGRHKEAAEQFGNALEFAEAAGADKGTLATLTLYQAESIKQKIAPMQASVKVQKQMQGTSPPPQVAILEKQLEGEFKDALELYRKAEQHAKEAGMPEEFMLQIQRSISEAYHDAGRFVKGVMQRKKLIQMAEQQKVEPLEVGFMYHGLGESQKEMGQTAEAAESYRKALTLKEKHGADDISLGKSWFALGECNAGMRKLEPALEAVRNAIKHEEAAEAEDDNARVRIKKYWHTLGLLLQTAGKEEESKEALEKAEKL
jgi:tetratricopeptide (TPR) repeat protein